VLTEATQPRWCQIEARSGNGCERSSLASYGTQSPGHPVGVVNKIAYLMRGLPSCGKSRRARELVGSTGMVCETDEFFFTQVGERSDKYDYDANRQQEAREWNFHRFMEAVDAGVTPLAVDRGNGLNAETQRYARYAMDHGYTVRLAEPDSPWWQEIRILLKYKEHTQPILDEWAEKLAHKNQATHRTPSRTIRRWIRNWNPNITVKAILEFSEYRREDKHSTE
jgi:hypothetical protein